MLQHLHIQNYALIENLAIDFAEGFSVLTGETGSGKSIILGALGLLLGERANLYSIGNREKKCIVEGHFAIQDYKLQDWFEQKELDYETLSTIRREIAPSGKSRAFINDTPVNLKVLRSLTSQLVDIHSQHQNLEIENESFQFQLLDSFSKNQEEKATYLAAYRKLKKVLQKRETLLASQQQQNADSDYWQFQWKELHTANLKKEEQEELEAESAILSKLENIQQAFSQAYDFLQTDSSPIPELQKLATSFQQTADVHAPSEELGQRLQSAVIELKDIAQEIALKFEEIENNPERASYVEERLDTIYRLEHKHGKTTVVELLSLQKELEAKIHDVKNFTERLEEVEKLVITHTAKANKAAQQLSISRKKNISKIEEEIIQQLQLLGMPHAKISLELQPTTNFRQHGKEHLHIRFSANKNTPFANISEIASGGELSRLMLTIKQLMAKSWILPTLIFDEIDTGVSGEIANKMAEMMQEMAQQMQLITITHLPQIAAKAKQHWEVYKYDTPEKTLTSITELNTEKRIETLAKMLSGSKLTQEAIANAKVLLGKP